MAFFRANSVNATYIWNTLFARCPSKANRSVYDKFRIAVECNIFKLHAKYDFDFELIASENKFSYNLKAYMHIKLRLSSIKCNFTGGMYKSLFIDIVKGKIRIQLKLFFSDEMYTLNNKQLFLNRYGSL